MLGIEWRNSQGWGKFRSKRELEQYLTEPSNCNNLNVYPLSIFYRGPAGVVGKLPDGEYKVRGPDARDPHWGCTLIIKDGKCTIK